MITNTPPQLRIVALYFVAAAAWILLSDALLYWLIVDDTLVPRLSILKGIAFVVFTSTVLFLLLKHEFAQRAQLERSLREQIERVEHSERRFRKAVEEAPQPIAILAEDGEIVSISHTWMEITGYTREQLSTIDSWSELAYGERKRSIKEGIDRLFDLDGRVDEGEFTVRCADGSERIWDFSSTPLDRLPNGRRLVMSLATDVTQRSRAEADLRIKDAAIAASLTPIVISDMEAKLTYVNQAFVKLWKLENESQAIGRSIHDFWDDPEAAAAISAAVLDEGAYVGELTARLADGEIALVEVMVTMVHDERGRPVCGMGSFKDITRQKQAEALTLENERVKVRFQKEQERNAFVLRIVSMLSHDLRSPLTVINSSKDLLLHYHDRLTPEKREEKLEVIGRQVQFALDMLTDTVDMARGKLTDTPFHPTPINIAALCQVSVEELRTDADVQLQLRFVNLDGTRVVLLDEVLVSRILLNLLSNAIKYSPVGREVRLELDIQESWVVLRVIDQGMGIQPEELPHIFNDFYRSEAVDHIQGTGLGLSIVKDCVERHGGEIHVESEVERGTTFTVRLPYQDAADSLSSLVG